VAVACPDRASVVIYMGDGEQTAAGAPTSFAPLRRLVQGGLVLGYGTAAGATMPAHQMTYAQTDQILVMNPRTGQPAVSHLDEVRLRGLAVELGLTYVHRGDGAAPTVPAPAVRLVVNAVSDLPGGSTEFTWIGALLLAVLLLGELFATVVALGRSGLPRGPR
jgi:Ca-activated chloride channel family protein